METLFVGKPTRNQFSYLQEVYTGRVSQTQNKKIVSEIECIKRPMVSIIPSWSPIQVLLLNLEAHLLLKSQYYKSSILLLPEAGL